MTDTVSLTEAVATPAEALKGSSLPELPAAVSSHPLLAEAAWVALRDSGIEPLVETKLVTTERSRAEFLVGAWLLDRTVKGDGLLANIKPQMLRVVDVLAAGRFKNAILEPRRSSKTTTLWCVLLGRCYMDELHMAGYTMATTQKKTAERYRIDVWGPITRQWPDENERPVKVYKGNGTERVEFPNGSLLAILSPDGEAFRSGAYDTLLVDEGGAASPETGEDITSAVLPAFDTRPDGQFIVAGTAAKYRETNILWDTLEDPKAAVLRYAVPDTVTEEELAAWEPTEEHPNARVRELIEQMHPGVDSGLTTLEKIQTNFETFTAVQFSEEYLGLFGTVGVTAGIFDREKWALAGAGGALPSPPPRFGLAFACHPDQLSGSILAAWRTDDGKAVPLLLETKRGVDWMAAALIRYSRKYSMPIVYDSGSQVASLVVEALNRARPRPKLDPQVFMGVKKGASLIVDEVARGNVEHYRQPELDAAVTVAVKRGTKLGNAWALGRREPDDDITAVEAWSLAQLVFDNSTPKTRRRTIVSSS
ncbi:hypothetical protein [Diaminobutyricimonas sp. LJ205]|uniref:hypothetical protein n=1 Tax=Diaminobutyricimonas sp. LJ205 TaxID=2683590 RepID=UPI0012F5072B|nr:hypothetical protein [Diaminobutyricimonas sp. LJ205]